MSSETRRSRPAAGLPAVLPLLAVLAGCGAAAELPVASGTEFSATLDQSVSTRTASPGDGGHRGGSAGVGGGELPREPAAP